MIVLKHDGVVYIAKCCYGFRDVVARKNGIPDVGNLCVWHPLKRKKRLIATTTSGCFADVLRYENIFPSHLDGKHLVLHTYPEVLSISDFFEMSDERGMYCNIVFAEEDRAFVLMTDGAYLEVENIYPYAADNEIVMALYDMKGITDPYQFLKEAYTSIELVTRYTMFPVAVFNTKNNQVEVIHR